MSTAAIPNPISQRLHTAADLLRSLGDVPPERVLLDPPPGTATEADVVRLVDGVDKVLCELVDGTLVEKPVGFTEAQLAAAIISFLGTFVREHNLGIVAGADAMVRMTGGNVRLPDVSFVAWADLPEGGVPNVAVAGFPITLPIEVLSPSNTKAEMRRKRQEYFASGSKAVWEFDVKSRVAHVFTAPDAFTTLGTDDTLTGGNVVPGFSLALSLLFSQLELKRP